MKVNALGNRLNQISLRGVERVGADITALVISNSTAIAGLRPDLLRAGYRVGVHFSLRRPDGQMIYAHAEVGLLQGDALTFLKGALLDLGEVTWNPVTDERESLEKPIGYLSAAVDAAIAARSELVISAEDDGSITVALVYRDAPRELRGPRGTLPRMEGPASDANFPHFFRLRGKKRKKRTA